MQTLALASWNVNSVRLRAEQVVRYAATARPDVLCLQEIKCREAEFPSAVFRDAGYEHILLSAQKGLHGVAIVSRLPLEPLVSPRLCPRGEARVVAARVNGVDVHCLYVPAGGDIPDREQNDKFGHKLDVLGNMRAHYDLGGKAPDRPLIIAGDLNIAPHPDDVWSHKELLDVVSHTPVETSGMLALQQEGGFSDLSRVWTPAPEKLFSWWSYRSPDWTRNNRGRRLDHIWWRSPSPWSLEAHHIARETRAWERPSDHVPVFVRLKVG
jgi:exodeoxyribonuclease-3